LLSQSPLQFPAPDFVLRSDFDEGKARTEFSLKKDKDGKATGTGFTVYGDPNLLIQLSSLSFSGDGSLLAVGSTPNIVDIWDVPHRIRLQSFAGGSTVALNSDGSLVATNGLAIWDTKTGKVIRRIKWEDGTNQPGVQRTVNKLHFSPSGTMLSVTSNGSDVIIYDLKSGQKMATLTETRDGQFSSDGSIFVGANYQVLTVWKVDGWKPLHVFPAGPDYVTAVAIAPDKGTVLVGGPNGTKLIDLNNGTVLAQFGDSYVSSVSYLADGSAAVIRDSKLALWNFKGQAGCTDTKLEARDALLSPGGEWLVGGAQHQRDVLLWKGKSIKTACSSSPKK
jgi:WD40 repeat protein